MAIIKKTDSFPKRPVIILIYGTPGVGKTSLLSTSENPILIDTDKGADRSAMKVDTLIASKWEDVLVEKDSFKDYKTCCIDTAKAVLDDYLSIYVCNKDYKLKNNKLKMYGSIGDEFKYFVNERRSENLDLVFTAHAKEEKDGDVIKVSPDVTGQSKDLLLRIADQVGYVTMVNNKRTIVFDPTDKSIGKNVANIEPLEIPDKYSPEFATFMDSLIKRVKEAISTQTEDQKKALEEVASLREKISSIKDTKDADSVLAELNGKPKTMAMPLKEALSEKVKELGFKYNKDAKKFELAQK